MKGFRIALGIVLTIGGGVVVGWIVWAASVIAVGYSKGDKGPSVWTSTTAAVLYMLAAGGTILALLRRAGLFS